MLNIRFLGTLNSMFTLPWPNDEQDVDSNIQQTGPFLETEAEPQTTWIDSKAAFSDQC